MRVPDFLLTNARSLLNDNARPAKVGRSGTLGKPAYDIGKEQLQEARFNVPVVLQHYCKLVQGQ